MVDKTKAKNQQKILSNRCRVAVLTSTNTHKIQKILLVEVGKARVKSQSKKFLPAVMGVVVDDKYISTHTEKIYQKSFPLWWSAATSASIYS